MGIKQDSGTQTPTGDAEVRKGSADDTSFTCPLSSQCTPKESCKAKCYNKAKCDAITGKDAAEAADLAKCLAECESVATSDSTPPPKDGGPDDSKVPEDQQQTDTCTPECGDKECGPDGCGGSCGSCTSPKVCDTEKGLCVTTCTPSCSGKQCGDDGCGGSCGTCSYGYYCDSYNQCKKKCTPSCSGKQCGDDGCGGSCGTCSSGYTCDVYGKCIKNCTPSCSGKQCGDDGCGGSCGTCSSGYTCDSSGQCKPSGVCAVEKLLSFSSGTLGDFTETHTDSLVKFQVVSNRYHTPSYAVRYGNPSANNFAGSGKNSGKLQLKSFFMPKYGTSTMKFWLYMDTETGTSYDRLKVTHTGLPGTVLWSKSSTNVTMKQWKEHTVDLGPTKGLTGQITFEFDTVDGSGNTGEGVYIDDVLLQLNCQ